MDRRQLLKSIALATGASVVGIPAMAVWEEQPPLTRVSDSGFSDSHVALITELCETVLPKTDTPGAKEAGLPPFFIGMVREYYTLQQQSLVEAGLNDIEQRCHDQYGKTFIELPKAQQLAIATLLDKEAIAFNQGASVHWSGDGFAGLPHYFTLYKQLMIFGFFTSKVGATQVLRHIDVPGDYKDIPYKKGDKGWATVWPV